jgi:predicted nucleotidyltransferase
MDYPKLTLGELVDRLKELMRSHGLHEAYVFGSRVRGDYLHRSDFDVIVVDDRYEGTPFLQRGLDVLRDWPYTFPELELFCYTRQEFLKGNTIIRAALKQGLQIVLEPDTATASPQPSP